VQENHPRPEGFTGQHLLVQPQKVIQEMQRHPLLRGFFPTAAGYFPEAPGHLVERAHGLPEMILIACLSGRGWVRLFHGERLPVLADEAVMIPPGTPHAYGADNEHPWSIMWAHCRGSELIHFQKMLGEAGAPAGSPLLHLPAGAFGQMGFSTIYETLESGYTLANLHSSASKLRFVFSEINRLRLPWHPRARPTEEGLRQSVAWMQRNLRRQADLGELAREAGLSAPHFSAMFKRRTGFAPINYFLRLKIQHACQLLATTPMQIKEISDAIGCEDAFYFSRLFKKIIGQSPRDFRRVQGQRSSSLFSVGQRKMPKHE